MPLTGGMILFFRLVSSSPLPPASQSVAALLRVPPPLSFEGEGRGERGGRGEDEEKKSYVYNI